ncbi:UDP-3-O-[3-hydroxymyristoyl] glucosamine N-acyltransferase [Spirosomataceae bacterium TFI 002]|nr:UDP-3-O-[3-hydroxymyristoyl] glucosamine N-acyltransferase [Spirosomataceae bacterium TFI 002]
MPMKFTVAQIANLIQGEIKGDATALIDNFYKIEEGQVGGISFLANPKYEDHAYSTNSSALIVSKAFRPKKEIKSTLIQVEDPYSAFSTLMLAYQKMSSGKKSGIHPSAIIAKSATVGENVSIGANVVIGENVVIESGVQVFPLCYVGDDVKIGRDTVLNAGVKIYNDCEIGADCVFHAGVVIGSDGFGFAPQSDGSFQTIPQLGNVKIGNDVHIGANSTVDRATMGSTVIGNGVKLDNLVQIGHNVKIGNHTVIAAQSGIAGSSEIGNYCILAGHVGVAGHVKVADKTKIAGKTGINRNIIEEGTSVSGVPHMSVKDDLKAKVVFKRLPKLEARVESIEKELKQKV